MPKVSKPRKHTAASAPTAAATAKVEAQTHRLARTKEWALAQEHAITDIGHVVGVDEVGRGALCGPLVVAACSIPSSVKAAWLGDIRDSKKLSAKARERLYAELTGHPDVRWEVVFVERDRVDELGIGLAVLMAMDDAALACAARLDGTKPVDASGSSSSSPSKSPATLVIVDGTEMPLRLAQSTQSDIGPKACTLAKADDLCLSVGAASIIAKTTRDRHMALLDRRLPGYDLAKNSGYGVPKHLEALNKLGPSREHRQSFDPMKSKLREGVWKRSAWSA